MLDFVIHSILTILVMFGVASGFYLFGVESFFLVVAGLFKEGHFFLACLPFATFGPVVAIISEFKFKMLIIYFSIWCLLWTIVFNLSNQGV